jgi:mono/diheme cytochrome c family protein
MKTLLATMGVLLAAAAGGAAQTVPAPIAAWNRTRAVPEDVGSRVERGAAVFNNWCSACHSRDVRNAPGTTSLQFKYQGKVPAALEDRRDLTPQSMRLLVRQGVATMPFSRKTEITDADLDALVAYLTQPKP